MNGPNVITEKIRDDILRRSSMASSRGGITTAIFDALVEAAVDWRTVPLHEIKSVLVEASRAFGARGTFVRRRPLSDVQPRRRQQ